VDPSPYLQAAAAGTYLVAAGAIFFGRWRAPRLPHPWFVLGLFLAFGCERAFPGYANLADPLVYVFAVLAGIQIAHATGGEHRGLWRALAFVPLLVVLLIASAARFPETDASAMRAGESALLALPALIALVYLGYGRTVTSRLRRT